MGASMDAGTGRSRGTTTSATLRPFAKALRAHSVSPLARPQCKQAVPRDCIVLLADSAGAQKRRSAAPTALEGFVYRGPSPAGLG
jgi:hypothetical protein